MFSNGQPVNVRSNTNIRQQPTTSSTAVRTIAPLADGTERFEALTAVRFDRLPLKEAQERDGWVAVSWRRYDTTKSPALQASAKGWVRKDLLTSPDPGSGTSGGAGTSTAPYARAGQKGELGIPAPFGFGFTLPDWLKGLPKWVIGLIALYLLYKLSQANKKRK